jgi:hypothetical protein
VSSEPSPSRVKNWSSITSTPFDPMESAGVLQDREIQCPKCRGVVGVRQAYSLPPPVYLCDVHYAALYNASGTGYIQQQFTFTCKCGFKIDKNKLGAFKFVGDLVKADSCLACAILHFPSGILTYTDFWYQRDSPHSYQYVGYCASEPSQKDGHTSIASLQQPSSR